ncbi:hypothetical protein D918_04727 [Trichuris suis]|nr:hypothetical protein D918_04727 [Trichuris suis]
MKSISTTVYGNLIIVYVQLPDYVFWKGGIAIDFGHRILRINWGQLHHGSDSATASHLLLFVSVIPYAFASFSFLLRSATYEAQTPRV